MFTTCSTKILKPLQDGPSFSWWHLSATAVFTRAHSILKWSRKIGIHQTHHIAPDSINKGVAKPQYWEIIGACAHQNGIEGL